MQSFQFCSLSLEMHVKAYMEFLLEHHSELNLPYSFPMKLSFISSPITLGNGLLLFRDKPYDVVGAAAFVFGTSDNDYEDRNIAQIEVAFLVKEYRSTELFGHGLRELLKVMKEQNPSVAEVRFWVPKENEPLKRLLGKLVSLPGCTISSVQHLDHYSIPFHELERYSKRFVRVQ